MKNILILITIALFATNGYGQQDPMFTHYMYNTLWLNPGYAGTRQALTITGIHRSQWIGFDGAPQDQSFTVHAPLFNGRSGMGISVIQDKIGPTQSSLLAADFAQHIQLNAKSKISFGLKGLLHFYNLNVSQLKTSTGNDQNFQQNTQSVLPNIGAGFYYSRTRFYAGISSPRIIENNLYGTAGKTMAKEKRHFYYIMGGSIPVNADIELKPSCFIKSTPAAPLQADITLLSEWNKRYSAGLMYRSLDAWGVLLGYNVAEAFSIGYAFDWSMTNTTGSYNSGSHELMLRYDLVSSRKGKIKSPRYF